MCSDKKYFIAILLLTISLVCKGQVPVEDHEVRPNGTFMFAQPDVCSEESLLAPSNLREVFHEDGLMLKWNKVQATFLCQIQGGIVGGELLHIFAEGYEPYKKYISYHTMEPSTDYEWKVRCACKTDPNTWGAYSENSYFTTPGFDIPYDPDQADKIVLYPNPVNETINIHYNKEADLSSMIEIYNLNGVLMIEEFLRSGLNMISTISLERGFYVAVIKGPAETTRVSFAKI